MNPFWLLPQKVQSVEEARVIIGRYQTQVTASAARQQSLAEVFGAELDVLCKTHPDLAVDLSTLCAAAQNLGHEEGARQALDTMLSDFRAALPYKIKLGL